MPTLILLVVVCLLSVCGNAQTISGKVTDKKEQPLEGVNVFIKDSYDGTITDAQGRFSFETTAGENAQVVFSYMGYTEETIPLSTLSQKFTTVKLSKSPDALNAVLLNAGSLNADGEGRAAVLKPLDVVTTAGAMGDIYTALQTLPGTSPNPDDGRLFVRGGNANETATFIDGREVFTPYSATVGNIPVRGRYSPFLFDGITFSTGGYSAEYNGALSGVLLLETTDFPAEEKTELQIMTVGGGGGHTEIWGDHSLSVNASYFNLAPYYALVPQNNDFTRDLQSLGSEAVYRYRTDDALFKAYAAYGYSGLGVQQSDLDSGDRFSVSRDNRNLYGNLFYRHRIKNGWKYDAGISFTYDHDDLNVGETDVDAKLYGLHSKINLYKRFSNYLKLQIGVESFVNSRNEAVQMSNNDFESDFSGERSAAFIESQIFLHSDFALKPGVRLDYYPYSNTYKVSPRLSMAYKISSRLQASAAYGHFYQEQPLEALQYKNGLDPAMSSHYIANLTYEGDNRLLRVEAYAKDYDGLLRFNTERPSFNSDYSTDGSGSANGIDIFWRDEKSIKNVEYWVSYSYVDSERLSDRFRESVTPPYVTEHSLSIVGKYWVDALQSQIGASYSYASGRPFNDLNNDGYFDGRTDSFQSLNLNWAYLIDDQKILYASVTNVLNRNNIFGYNYSTTPEVNGTFRREAITQAADQFFFVGFFWTLKGSDNQLDNL